MAIFPSKKLKWILFTVLVVALLVGAGFFIFIQATTEAIANRVNTDEFGIAIQGYDTVAYHTENRPVKGKSKYSYSWNDAAWHFASAENRDLFAENPERWAPQYGGY